MSGWEYCYVNESLESADGGGLEREYFIARPDRAESRRDIKENQLLAILGSEGWELVSVVGVQSQYSEGRVDMGECRTRAQYKGPPTLLAPCTASSGLTSSGLTLRMTR